MDEYKKLTASYKEIKRFCSNSDELCSLVYRESRGPAFELYQPSRMGQSPGTQSSQSTNSSQSSDTDPGTNITTLRLLESQSRSLSSSTHSHLLSSEQRKSFKGLVLVAKDMIKNGKISKGNLSSNLAKIRNLPLEVLWWYHCSEIMHITIFIALNLSQSEELERLCSGLNDLMGVDTGDGVSAAIVSDFLKALTAMVLGPEPPTSLQDTRKACRIIQHSIMRKQIVAIKEGTAGIWWIPQLIGETSTLPPSVVKICASNMLTLQLTEPPYISVHQALARQSEWSFSLSPQLLTTFFKYVLRALGSPQEGLESLKAVLHGDSDVNWKSVLICFSSFINCIFQAANFMADMVIETVKEALSSENEELMLLSFLLARQCAVEGSLHGCLTYPAWFKKTFGNKNLTLATSQSSCAFLIKFLTHLVPYEPAACLKAHTDQSPWVPVSCRPQLQDYLALVSTRLRDLGRGSSDVVNGLFQTEGEQILTMAEQVQFDIEKAIEYFEKSGKVHGSVLEGSMFKKKYFETNFLPGLLKPRSLPSTNDAQMLLIDKLLKVGKISTVQYNNFHSQCLAAASSSSSSV